VLIKSSNGFDVHSNLGVHSNIKLHTSSQLIAAEHKTSRKNLTLFPLEKAIYKIKNNCCAV